MLGELKEKMELVNLSINDFYGKYIEEAKKRGYKWIITLVAHQDDDIGNLYNNLYKAWDSLDSVTGKKFLFTIFNKRNIKDAFKFEDKNSVKPKSTIFSRDKESIEWGKVINKDIESDMFYKLLMYQNESLRVRKAQTAEVNSIKTFFSIPESKVPCLVFTNINKINCTSSLSNIRGDSIIVPIHGDDIYKYFKTLFNKIDPLLKEEEKAELIYNELMKEYYKLKTEEEEVTKWNKILKEREELFLFNKDLKDENEKTLFDCANNLEYGKFETPVYSKLNKYIKQVKKYQKINGEKFDYDAIIAREMDINEKEGILYPKVENARLEVKKIKTKIEEIIKHHKMNKNLDDRDNRKKIKIKAADIIIEIIIGIIIGIIVAGIIYLLKWN